MKTWLVLIPVMFLIGCTATPVKRTFPEVPAELTAACPDLELVDPETQKLSDVVRVVTDNYTQYHLCREKVSAWNSWYKTQRMIFDSVK